MWLTSAAVAGPCSFWPFSISFSSSSMDWRTTYTSKDERNIQSNTVYVVYVPFDEVFKAEAFILKVFRLQKSFFKLITSPSPSLQKLLLLYGCGRRNTSLWDRPPRSSPGTLPRTRDLRCKRCGRRRSSPSDPVWSLRPWCCLRSPVRHRTQHRLLQCSEKQTRCKYERRFAWTTWWWRDHHGYHPQMWRYLKIKYWKFKIKISWIPVWGKNAPVLSNTVVNTVTDSAFVITVAHQPTQQMLVA